MPDFPWWLTPLIPPILEMNSVIWSSNPLARNMRNTKPTGTGYEAHHIVQWDRNNRYELARRTQELLTEFGIRIHNIENGVWLAMNYHRRLNTNEYREAVFRSLNGATSQSDIIRRLDAIRLSIQQGTFPY